MAHGIHERRDVPRRLMKFISLGGRFVAVAAALALVSSVAWYGTAHADTGTVRWVNNQVPTTADAPPGMNCSHPGYNTIEAAVVASSAGDTVRVCPGTYTETAPVTVSNLTLRGSGSGRCAASRDTSRKTTVIDSSGPDGVVLAADGISFSGFDVQNNSSGPGVSTDTPFAGYRINDNVFSNNTLGLYFNSGGSASSAAESNCFLGNNQPGPASGDGIYEDQGLTNAVISANLFDNNTSSAVVLISPSNVTMSRNSSSGDGSLLAIINGTGGAVSSNRASGDPGTAIYLCGASDLLVGRNAVRGSGAGLFVDGPSDGCNPSSQLEVQRNRVDGSATYAMFVGPGSLSGSTIERNRVSQSAVDGIFVASGTNVLAFNRASNSGQFDCQDVTTGAGTAGTANTWLNDQGKTSSPQGICSSGGPAGASSAPRRSHSEEMAVVDGRVQRLRDQVGP